MKFYYTGSIVSVHLQKKKLFLSSANHSIFTVTLKENLKKILFDV